MANPRKLQKYGNQILVIMDDNTRLLAYPTQGGLWVVKPGSGTNPPDPGDGSIYNPWAGQITYQNWEQHVSSAGRGGQDWDPGDDAPVNAPAAGMLYTNGQVPGTSGNEYMASNNTAGGAGRRSIIWLDSPRTRVQAAGSSEAAGPMTAIVFQHLKSQRNGGPITRAEQLGVQGGSGNGSETGYPSHIHVHGLDAAGARVDFIKFIP